MGINIFVGPWLGHFNTHWKNLAACVEKSYTAKEHNFLGLAMPRQMPEALGRALCLIIGGPVSTKTSHHAINAIRKNLQSSCRNVWLNPTTISRSNSTRALHNAFPGKIQVIGHPHLTDLEKTVKLEHVLCQNLREESSAIKTFAAASKETTNPRRSLRRSTAQPNETTSFDEMQQPAFSDVVELHIS